MNVSIFLCVIYIIVTVGLAENTDVEVLILTTEAETLSTTAADMEKNRNSTSLKCLKYKLRKGQYELFSNGTVYIEAYNRTLNESQYILENGELEICMIEVSARKADVEVFTLNTEAETLSTKSADMEKDKNSTSLKCRDIIYLDRDEYELYPNGTVYIGPYNRTFNESEYILKNGTLKVCSPFKIDGEDFKEYMKKTTHLTLIGIGISMICLFIHLIVFAIVPDLKNLPGCNLAALCASLVCSYLIFFVIGSGKLMKYTDLCRATAFLAHFFFLSALIWMSIMSYDVFSSLRHATGNLRLISTRFSFKRFGLYCLCSFGVALLFAIASLLADTLDGVPKRFKPEYEAGRCWFGNKASLLIFCAGPLFALTCLNFIFFCLSACTLHFNKMKQDQDQEKARLKRRYLMYFRLSAIMGVTWILAIIAVFTDAVWLWGLFVLLNTLQGFFIFISFTCSEKVKKYFREKYFNKRK